MVLKLAEVKNIIEKVRPKNIPAEEFLLVKYQAHKGPIIDIAAKIPPNKPAEIAPAKMSLWGWVNLYEKFSLSNGNKAENRSGNPYPIIGLFKIAAKEAVHNSVLTKLELSIASPVVRVIIPFKILKRWSLFIIPDNWSLTIKQVANIE